MVWGGFKKKTTLVQYPPLLKKKRKFVEECNDFGMSSVWIILNIKEFPTRRNELEIELSFAWLRKKIFLWKKLLLKTLRFHGGENFRPLCKTLIIWQPKKPLRIIELAKKKKKFLSIMAFKTRIFKSRKKEHAMPISINKVIQYIRKKETKNNPVKWINHGISFRRITKKLIIIISNNRS